MKTYSYFTLLAALLFSVATLAQTKNQVEISFPTTGNCYFCKERIEEACLGVTGVKEVLWDAGTDVTTIAYEDTQTDAYEIMQTIANVGHETEWFPANDSAYAMLEGTCCFYTKVIDYSNVQVGYLGLMDLWVWPLTGISNPEDQNIQVSPTTGDGMFTISGNMNKAINVEVFTINGQQVHSESVPADGNATINLSHLNSGCYLIVLSRDNQVINSSKVFKN